MSIWAYEALFASPPAEDRVSLGEGRTPVIAARRLGPALGLEQLLLKLEISNPTGSYKDRFAAAAISHMRTCGQTKCLATSSGNTGSALAAYCAGAGIPCTIAIVEPAPLGKLTQMLAYGATLLRVRGFGLDPIVTQQVLTGLATAAEHPDIALQISAYCYSPLGMAGVQTISYELAEQLNSMDHVFVPAGGGGLTLAIARGFQDLVRIGRLARSPRIHCVQPEGNATIARPLRSAGEHAERVDCTTTISGLQVPIVLDGDEVIAACRASGGTGYLVSDQAVLTLQKRLAREEGIFTEPAGAVALAGVAQAIANGEIGSHERVVCVVTGSGFKDSAAAEAMIADSTCPLVTASELFARI